MCDGVGIVTLARVFVTDRMNLKSSLTIGLIRLIRFVASGAGEAAEMAKHPEFMQALKVGKSEADDRVERSLYQRAVGYTYPAVKIFMPAGAKTPIYAPYDEHVPPDVTAGIFWSKNRRPDKWRDTWHLEAAVGKYLISDKPMTPEQWIRERALLVDGEATDVTPAAPKGSDE
jgi:hypothetical protein